MAKRSDPPTNSPEARNAQELYLLMAFRKLPEIDRAWLSRLMQTRAHRAELEYQQAMANRPALRLVQGGRNGTK